jgi:hypothetical protein
MRWANWLCRAVLLGLIGAHALSDNAAGAVVAAEGLAVSLLPLLLARLSGIPIPAALELAFVAGMTLQFGSESTKLFELFTYWDKLVHPTLVALATLLVAWLLLGFRDAFGVRLPRRVIAATALLVGMGIGAGWEFIEFAADWFGNVNLQKSNGDTMTDILANDIGAGTAMVLALWLYRRGLQATERRALGELAAWLGAGPARLLDRHGGLVGLVVTAACCALLAWGWWLDGDPAALAGGLGGASQTWDFTATDGLADTRVLSGNWLPTPGVGVCRVDADSPAPGSEQMGILGLAPDRVYGADGQAFQLEATYVEVRPPMWHGTEMDGGLAFGIHDARNFELLEQSALHDVLRFDRFVDGTRRDVREELLRTRGEQWHTLRVTVDGSRASALIDGEVLLADISLAQPAGGIGLWARTAAATCFSRASVQVGGVAAP